MIIKRHEWLSTVVLTLSTGRAVHVFRKKKLKGEPKGDRTVTSTFQKTPRKAYPTLPHSLHSLIPFSFSSTGSFSGMRSLSLVSLYKSWCPAHSYITKLMHSHLQHLEFILPCSSHHNALLLLPLNDSIMHSIIIHTFRIGLLHFISNTMFDAILGTENRIRARSVLPVSTAVLELSVTNTPCA